MDDEVEITRHIEITARSLGFEVMSIHESARFEEGLAHVRPTIIFLDITMPDRDGVELIGVLAARNYPGQIVIMSGKGEIYIQMSSAIAKARGLAMAGTLIKPFSRDTLRDLLIRVSLPPD